MQANFLWDQYSCGVVTSPQSLYGDCFIRDPTIMIKDWVITRTFALNLQLDSQFE